MRISRSVALLALFLAAVPIAVIWNDQQVDRESHALHMLLSRARVHALTTLDEVRYRSTEGEGTLVFGPNGATNPYNIHLHGGDITLGSWVGHTRSMWIHCTGGITEGRNDDWTLNARDAAGQ